MILAPLVLAATTASIAAPPAGRVAISTVDANQWAAIDLYVVAWDKPTVAVEQTTIAGNGADVHVELRSDRGGTTVTARYTGRQKTRLFGLFRGGDGDRVRWVVHAPAHAPLTVRESNGGMDVAGVVAPLDLLTSNGGIGVRGGGPVMKVHASNGGINVAMTTLEGGPPNVSISSNNGGIELAVPAHFSAPVRARSSNGGVENPFQQNTGPGSVDVQTHNGGIRIYSKP